MKFRIKHEKFNNSQKERFVIEYKAWTFGWFEYRPHPDYSCTLAFDTEEKAKEWIAIANDKPVILKYIN